MGGDADMRQAGKDMFGHAVIDHAFACNRTLFLRVKRGGIVFELLDQRSGLWTFIQDLGLAFVNFAAAGHGLVHSQSVKTNNPGDDVPGFHPL